MKKLTILLCVGLFACVSWVGAQNETGVVESERIVKFKKAAENSVVNAQYNLAICYESGEGVAENYSEAIKWYRKAAENGMADAQYSMALHYAYEENLVETLKWLKKAASQGYKDAIELLNEIE